MPLLTWKDEYTVQNEELDNHHKCLVNIVNRIYDNCLQIDAVNCIGPHITELLDYADYHFTAEEAYLKQIEYYERDEHHEQHEQFVFKLKELKQAYSDNEIELTKSLLVFLGKWLLHHVLVEDRKYALHARSIQTKNERGH